MSTNTTVHMVLWIAAVVLAILAIVGVKFEALAFAVLCGGAAELLGEAFGERR